MPILTETKNFLVVGAVYIDLEYELPTDALKSSVDSQLFCEASFRVGGTGYNQARILGASVQLDQKVKLITLLGQDPVSVLAKDIIKKTPSSFQIETLETSVDASPPIVSILREKLASTSRRIMIGPPNRYISGLWTELIKIGNETNSCETTALIFDGYSLTSYELNFEQILHAFTKNFSSSTLLLLPHNIYTVLDKEQFFSAMKCFGNLESSFYTVSRIILNVGDTGVPSDDLIIATVRQLLSNHPTCELNLRFGILDAQFCVHYQGGSKVDIIEYDIDGFGQRSVGDQIQVREMINPSELIEKHRRELSI